MSETKQIIIRHEVADYLKVGGAFEVMSVFNQIDENTTAQTKETQYTADKAKTKITTGYAVSFPITADMYKNEKTAEWLRDVAEEQKVGADAQTEYIRVRLYQPIDSKPNTYYARKFVVSAEITAITGAGGENMVIAGNLNAVGNVVIGEFNVQSKTFTPKVGG